jgi:hypothetical protein
MGSSIRVCILEKNRCRGKAVLSRSHESILDSVLSGLASSLASQLPQGYMLVMNDVFTPKSCGSWLASDGRATDSGNVTVRKFLAEKINQRAHRWQQPAP